MRIMISGIGGRMGSVLASLASEGAYGARLICGVDRSAEHCTVPCFRSVRNARTDVDCVIDFSSHTQTDELLSFCTSNSIPLVIATTGQTDGENAMIERASKHIPIFMSANYSVGIAILTGFAKKLAKAMPDAEIEIVETHHDGKADAPSGTAAAIADAVRTIRPELTVHPGRTGYGIRSKTEIGIHSVRIAASAGEHEVIFSTPAETVRLTHEATDRRLYADGALRAARFLCSLPKGSAGLYTMESMIGDSL